MDRADVVIVGAGHGGAQAALALRQRKFAGTVLMIGEEPEIPYERPPLSKDYFSGEKAFERILIRPASFWSERDVEILTSSRVVSVDPAAKTVGLEDGRTIGYGELIWAAGGHARKLSCMGFDHAGVHSVRSRADVDRMMGELETTTRVALSRFYEAEHRAHGVDMRLGVQVDCIEGTDGQVTGVRLVDGEVVPAEMVIVGIGIIPAVQPLLEAGARGGNGVSVDEHGRTSLPHVWAIGDCAMHANAFAEGLPIRLESVQNANDMATTVAKAITGEPEAYHAVPWFWSNQYDLKLQTVGLSAGHEEEILRGDPATRAFSIVYLKQGRVVAIDAVNAVKDYVQGKALVVGRVQADPAQLADPDVPLKSLAG